MSSRRSGRLAALAVLVSMAACGGNGAVAPSATPTPSPSPVQRVLAAGRDAIESFTVDPADGRLVSAPRIALPSPSLTAMVMPASDRLYVGTINGLEGYRMDLVRGTLTPLPGSPYAARVTGLSLAPSGAFVHALTTERSFVALRVESSGALVEVGRTAAPEFQQPVAFEPGGRYAYGFAGQALAGYRVEASGVLTALPGSPYPLPTNDPNAGPLRPARFGPFLYALTPGVGQVVPGGVRVYQFDPVSGIPEQVVRYRAPEDRIPSALDLSGSGSMLYVSYRTQFVTDEAPMFVQSYVVDTTTGRLAESSRLDVGRSIFSLMRVSADGRSLFVTLEPSRFAEPFPPTLLAALRLDMAEQLAAVAGAPQPAGTFPHSLLALHR